MKKAVKMQCSQAQVSNLCPWHIFEVNKNRVCGTTLACSRLEDSWKSGLRNKTGAKQLWVLGRDWACFFAVAHFSARLH